MEAIPLWCDICHQMFSGPTSAQQHFQSSKHRQKENNVACFGKSGLFCQVCHIRCDTRKMITIHELSRRHLAMVQKQQQLSMSVTQASLETGLHEHNQSTDRSTGSLNKDKEYEFNGFRGYCYICDLDLTSEDHATDHLNGKNHTKKKRQSERAQAHFKSKRHKGNHENKDIQNNCSTNQASIKSYIPDFPKEISHNDGLIDRKWHAERSENLDFSDFYRNWKTRDFESLVNRYRSLSSDSNICRTSSEGSLTGTCSDVSLTETPSEGSLTGTYSEGSLTETFSEGFSKESPKQYDYRFSDTEERGWCNVCNIALTSKNHMRQHVVGCKHNKAREVWARDAHIGPYTCNVCYMEFTGPEPHQQHLNSEKHKNRAKRYGKEYFCDTCKVPCSGEVSYIQHLAGKQHIKKSGEIAAHYRHEKTVKEPKQFVKPEITDEPVPVIKRFGIVDTRTGVHATDIDHETPVNEEGRTKRGHGSDLARATRSKNIGPNVKRDIEERSTDMRSNVSSDTSDMSHEKSTPKLSSLQLATLENRNPYAATHTYYCQTCKVPMNTRERYEVHIRGSRHVTKACNEIAPDRLHMPRMHLDLNEIPKTKMEPRNYQVELFRKSMIWDTLCFLPTGTGKTLVSVLSMCRMLQEFPSKNVLFLVDKVLLVLQQSKFIKQQIGDNRFVRYDPDSDGYQRRVKRHLNIAAVCMDQQNTNGLPMWKQDVVIVTAAFCNNLLDQGKIKWSDFSLVVFDEAHHCEKRHPFNTLLLQYHIKILAPKQRPKVLGLTASPAGQSDVPKTVVMLKNLLANMGHSKMNVVEEPKNVAKLEAIQSNAEIIVKETGRDVSHKAGSHIKSILRELIKASDGKQSHYRKPMSLVLVKERSTAHKLCTELNVSIEMKRRRLKCVVVVGHGRSGAADKGMSVAQQKRVLEEIKRHKYQVVIATSVAEEGVDWPECDCVISMYPPSTVTALVQMRGRARIKRSKFIILCENRMERKELQDVMRREANMVEATRMIVQRQNTAYK